MALDFFAFGLSGAIGPMNWPKINMAISPPMIVRKQPEGLAILKNYGHPDPSHGECGNKKAVPLSRDGSLDSYS